MSPQHVTQLAPEKVQPRLVHEIDMAFEIGGDESATHRMQDVLLHHLEILQLVALYVQLDADLPQLRA